MSERPWGFFEVLVTEPSFQIKRLTVRPGGRLSLQRHRFRREHWLILAGQAEITLDGLTLELKKGECAHIPQGSLHRVRNDGPETLIILETQTGTYFGEDDIERLEDDYGRPPTESLPV